MNDMKIRRLAKSDLDPLLALYAHLHAQDAPLPARQIVEEVWEELTGSGPHTCLGGFVDGELVASCTLSVVPNLTRGCRPYGIIENVVTHAGFRRRGYGRRLLAEALAEAWRQGCYKVMLQTGRKDEATLRFYESAGFDRTAKQAFVARPPAG